MDDSLDCVKKVVGMEEGESDYSVVHLGAETQGLPAFHRIVGEDEVTFNHYQFCHCFVLLVLGTANSYIPFTVGDKTVLQPRGNGTCDLFQHLESFRFSSNHISTLRDSGENISSH